MTQPIDKPAVVSTPNPVADAVLTRSDVLSVEDVSAVQQFTGTIDQVVAPVLRGDAYEYNGTSSYQPVAIDLELGTAAGNAATNPKFLAPVMGNIIGDGQTKVGAYNAGLIGANSVTGTNASEWPTAGVLGIVMDGVTDLDSAVHAHLDGSDPSAQTNVRAMFGVSIANNHASSSAQFGLDLHGPASANITTGRALVYTKADARLANNVVIITGAGAPVDGTTGDNVAGPGSLYIDITGANAYVQTAVITSPVWKLVTRAA